MSAQAPISPLFPVIADELLADGNILEAVALCEQGVAAFPRYSTGYLIAAKAYMHAKRFADAKQMCRTGLSYTSSSKALVKMQEIIAAEEKKHAQSAAVPPKAATPEKELHDAAETEETALGKLARELKGAKIPTVDPAAPLPEEEAAKPEHGIFASSTLAGIYEKQGAYDEAIKAYTALAEQSPALRDEYDKKIEALKKMKNEKRIMKNEGDKK